MFHQFDTTCLSHAAKRRTAFQPNEAQQISASDAREQYPKDGVAHDLCQHTCWQLEW